MEFRQLDGDFGTVAETSDARSFADQLREAVPQVIERLKQTGVVFFSGAGITVEEFEALTELISASDLPNNVSLHGKKARGVFTGRPFLGLHAEQKFLPWSPDLISFHCTRPANDGGRTLVCDGFRFINELSPATLEFFRNEKLLFDMRLKRSLWRAMFRVQTTKQVRKVLDHPDLKISIWPFIETMRYRYTVSALQKPHYQNADAFVNCVIHALDDPGYYNLKMANGKPIPASIEAEIRTLGDKIAVPIPWQSGDFAIIDNSRVMHGREAYADTNRKVSAKHGMARFN